MFRDDDDEDEVLMGVTRYGVMPSLMALQQMRNRHQLATLGKKLMKWTMMAAGKELRRLAFELCRSYATYGEDVRTAYIKLARARFFVPFLNDIVRENHPHKSRLTIASTTKVVSGFKLIRYMVLDSNEDPYPFLGISQGGNSVQDAKDFWLKLIKRIIEVIEIRTSFEHVAMTHLSATKRYNIFSKKYMPMIKMTVKYIKQELEELNREEYFRLKLTKKKKLTSKSFKLETVHKEVSGILYKEVSDDLHEEVSGKLLEKEIKNSDITFKIIKKEKSVHEKMVNPSMFLDFNEPKNHFKDEMMIKLHFAFEEIKRLTEIAKTKSLISNSLEQILNSIRKDDKPKFYLEHTLAEYNSLKYNIENVISIYNKLKRHGFNTENIENNLQNCYTVKKKLELFDQHLVIPSSNRNLNSHSTILKETSHKSSKTNTLESYCSSYELKTSSSNKHVVVKDKDLKCSESYQRELLDNLHLPHDSNVKPASSFLSKGKSPSYKQEIKKNDSNIKASSTFLSKEKSPGYKQETDRNYSNIKPSSSILIKEKSTSDKQEINRNCCNIKPPSSFLSKEIIISDKQEIHRNEKQLQGNFTTSSTPCASRDIIFEEKKLTAAVDTRPVKKTSQGDQFFSEEVSSVTYSTQSEGFSDGNTRDIQLNEEGIRDVGFKKNVTTIKKIQRVWNGNRITREGIIAAINRQFESDSLLEDDDSTEDYENSTDDNVKEDDNKYVNFCAIPHQFGLWKVYSDTFLKHTSNTLLLFRQCVSDNSLCQVD